MPRKALATPSVSVNRAPVLTLWAAVVAERQGFDPDEALTLGRAVAGLNAQSTGRKLGIFHPPKDKEEKDRPKRPSGVILVEVLGLSLPAKETESGRSRQECPRQFHQMEFIENNQSPNDRTGIDVSLSL